MSQCSVVTNLRCDEVFDYHCAANLLLSESVKEFWESRLRIDRVSTSLVSFFLGHSVYFYCTFLLRLSCVYVIRRDFQRCILLHRMATMKALGFFCLLDVVQITETVYVLHHVFLLLCFLCY